jgi:CheY-like chemotaxis protein
MTELKVLVADDHVINRVVLKAMLKQFGCSVDTVNDGEAAVAEGGDYDIVVLDRHMPGIGGDEAAMALAGRAFLVAYTTDLDNLPHTYDFVLAKPLSMLAVRKMVDRARDAAAIRRRSDPFSQRLGPDLSVVTTAGASRRR